MKIILGLIAAFVALLIGLFVWDLVNMGIGERRVKEARFYLENADGTPLSDANPDEASKLAARAIRKLNSFPTIHGGRRDRTVEAGSEVLLRGLTGMFAEQYGRDLRFHPGPQWEICEARASVVDKGLCVEAAALGAQAYLHRQYRQGTGDAGVGVLKECVGYTDRPGIGDVCKSEAGRWLAEETADQIELGETLAAVEAMHACVTNPDHWPAAPECLADWHRTVRRARNALLPKHNACKAILYYAAMPEGIPASEREQAEAELAELRSTTALIWTQFHYDTLEFSPATGYWGLGEESTKYHLSQVLNPVGYTIQWHEEEHPEGAWDACDPAYVGKIILHEKPGRRIEAFHKEVMTVRPQVELFLNEGNSNRLWVRELADGREPKEWFRDEEFFLDQAARARDAAWQAAHDSMREWEIDPPASKQVD